MRRVLTLFLRVARRLARLLGAGQTPPLREPFSYRTDPMVPPFDDALRVVVIDGECVLCSRFAGFILRRDYRRRYRLVVARSETGAALFRHFGLRIDPYETILLIENGCGFVRSEAAIRILAGLGFPWNVLRLARGLPFAIREAAYSWLTRAMQKPTT